MNIKKPYPLHQGATIGIISPSSPQRDPARLERGIAYFESKGYNVKIGAHALHSTAGYLAGSDEDRISDIESMFADDSVDAIFCARGGYGTTRILSQLNYDIIASNPKILVGFSDTTALQSAIFSQTGLITFSGAMPSVDFADEIDQFTENSFFSALTEDISGKVFSTNPHRSFHAGVANGRLICGNLCLFATICGSQYFPEMHDAILLIEDIGEEEYRIDRYLSQLELSGHLHAAQGILIGDFTPPTSPVASVPQRSYQEIFIDYAKRSGKPTLGDFPYGHIKRKMTIPFGIRITMNADTGTITFMESQFG
jgi:muramoyltetrapeptide carboxypeptidase